ncbi:MAG: FlgD immunoglobulin-like domain containing protein [Elusimicrobiota bacterium]
MLYSEIRKFVIGLCFIVFCSIPALSEPYFKDESPGASWRYGDIMSCYVTSVSTDSDLDNDSVRYRTSNSGSELENFTEWRADGVVIVSSSTEESRFQIAVDEDRNLFEPGEDNYIQWQVKDKAGVTVNSNRYNIKIYQNYPPELKKVQPGEFTSLSPELEIEITECPQGIEVNSIEINISEIGAGNIYNIKGSDNPEIYDSSDKIIKYSFKEKIFEEGKEYKIKVKVSDTGYVEPESTEISYNTTAGDGVIADFINFPNPFNGENEETVFRYDLKNAARVTINIYDSSRVLVKKLVDGKNRSKGLHEEPWNGNNFSGNKLANGIYYAEIIAENNEKSKRYSSVAILTE